MAVTQPPAGDGGFLGSRAANRAFAERVRNTADFVPARRTGWAILLLAAAIRLYFAATLPCISRDGVTFCHYARDLGDRGIAHLRDPATRQHPLYPLLILCVERGATFVGVEPSPWAWQRCGQTISFVAGMAVVFLIGRLAWALVRRAQLPLAPESAANVAMLIAALTPLNVWLSSDVMSDQIHLAFYLAAALFMVEPARVGVCLAIGLFGGLAFLTRPEGAIAALAGITAVFASRPSASPAGPSKPLRAAAICFGFLIAATPFWAVTGKFSPKKDVLGADAVTAAPTWQVRSDCPHRIAAHRLCREKTGTTNADEHAGGIPAIAVFARLERTDYSWYALLPQTLLTLFRAGRVVIPLFALLPLLNLRRRMIALPFAGLTACMLGHLSLVLMLLARHDYQDQRHLLVIVALLTPFAAFFLTRLHQLAIERRRAALHLAPALLAYLPLAWYAVHRVNPHDGVWPAAATALAASDERLAERLILTGSSGRRLAFYGGAAIADWYETPDDYAHLRSVTNERRPDYLVIETGEDFETRENSRILQQYLDDREIPAERTAAYSATRGPKNRIHVIRLRWPGHS